MVIIAQVKNLNLNNVLLALIAECKVLFPALHVLLATILATILKQHQNSASPRHQVTILRTVCSQLVRKVTTLIGPFHSASPVLQVSCVPVQVISASTIPAP